MPELGNCWRGKEAGAEKDEEAWLIMPPAPAPAPDPIPDCADTAAPGPGAGAPRAGGGVTVPLPPLKLLLEMLLFTGDIWREVDIRYVKCKT